MEKHTVNGKNGRPQLLDLLRKADFSSKTLRDYAYVIVGSFIQAIAMRLFLIPSLLVAGGVSGGAQIINFFTDWPIGLMTFLGNAPLFLIGWRYLGGARFALRTGVGVLAFSALTDLTVYFLPNGLTDDLVLNTLYGGLLLGVGLGVVYRGKGTSGGTDILARVFNERFHMSISQAYMASDAIVIVASGLAFGWKQALYSLVVIYVAGLAAEMASEGSDVFRTAMIVTTKPTEIAEQVMAVLERGVTVLSGKGAYTGEDRPVLYCVVTRPEVNQLKTLVHEIDPKAFMVIGIAHDALGEGFRPLRR